MKDCVRFAPMIGSREGELPREDAAALAAHLDTCARCRTFAAEVAASEGLVSDGLMARAAARDFAPFVDAVMDRVGAGDGAAIPARAEPVEARAGERILAWLARHRRALLASLAPVVAAAAILMYVRSDGRSTHVAQLEVAAEGDVTTVLETSDGPVVLLGEERS